MSRFAAERRAGILIRILVGHSLDDRGDDAVREAISIGQYGTSAELVVAHVLDADASSLETSASLEARAKAALAERVWKIVRDEPARVQLEIRVGSPVATLARLMAELEPDLVVLGAARCHEGGRPQPGSIAQELGAMSRTPVLTAHPRSGPGAAPGDPPAE